MSVAPRFFRDRSKDIVPYLEATLRLTEGAYRGECIKFKNSPWMIRPLLKWEDDRIQRVTILKGTGCGGTYVAEGGAAYKANVRPSNIGYQIWTKPKAQRIGRRLNNKLDLMPEFQRRQSSKNHARRKLEHEFTWPPTNLYIQEASETAAQTDRLEDVILDEPWLYPAGRMSEFWKRTNGAMPYFKHVAVSSAPRSPTHELALEWDEGCQDEYHLACIGCHGLFIPVTGDESELRYQMHVIQWEKGNLGHIQSTAKIVCPHCTKEYPDIPNLRRELLEGAQYQPSNPGAPLKYYSCRWNSWVAWFVPYADLVSEYYAGRAAAKRGDASKLEDFQIKREARPWQGADVNARKLFITGDYELMEVDHPVQSENVETKMIWRAPDWDLEQDAEEGYRYGRFAGVDVQQSWLWVWIIQATLSGEQRLLWCGRVRTWAELLVILEFLEVPPWQVGVDMGYERGIEVPRQIIANGWTALRGQSDPENDGFIHNYEDDDVKGSERLAYSEPVEWDISARRSFKEGDPRQITVRNWSHRRVMDALWNLRNGDGEYWGMPTNYEYLEDRSWTEQEKISNQLDSTRFVRKSKQTDSNANLKDESIPMIWQKKASHVRDDLWDCASMVIVLMMMQGYY